MPFGDWSWPDPLEIPDSSPDESDFHYCRFNESYLSFVLGAVENLLNPVTWAGDDSQVAESLEKIHTLLDEIATYRTTTLTPLYARIGQKESANVGAGTPTTGAWTARVINYTFYNGDGLVTRSGNSFTVPAGMYRFAAYVPFWGANASGLYYRLRLANSDGSKIAIQPITLYSYASNIGLLLPLTGDFWQTDSTYWELQYYTNNSRANTGLGAPINVAGEPETYTVIEIEKIG